MRLQPCMGPQKLVRQSSDDPTRLLTQQGDEQIAGVDLFEALRQLCKRGLFRWHTVARMILDDKTNAMLSVTFV